MTHVDIAGTTGVPNVVLDVTYDAAGNRFMLDASIDGTADYHNDYIYDPLNRLSRISQSDASPGTGYTVSEKRVDISYNAVGQFSGISRYEDLAGTGLVAYTGFLYDAAGRLTDLDHTKGPVNLVHYGLSYDDDGRLTQFVSPDGTNNYTYDATSQLTGATLTGESYSYDDTGNRTNTGYSTGTNNQLLSDGTWDYEYDAEGNRTKKTNQTTGDYVEYTWDHRNRLAAVTFRDSSHVKTKEVTYTYDVFDRLIGKQVDDDGDGTVDRAQAFVYDGQNVVLVFDESGSLTNRFLHGPTVDQVFASEDDLGEVLWALTDNQGTVRDIADYDAGTDTTTIVNHRQFDSFGNLTAESDPNVAFRYAYTGRFFDEDTGLQYNRARWYDPGVGRWISEDPIGFNAGDPNLSRYVGNSPTNFTDPSGLDPGPQPELSDFAYIANEHARYEAWVMADMAWLDLQLAAEDGDDTAPHYDVLDWFAPPPDSTIAPTLGDWIHSGVSLIPGGEEHLVNMGPIEALAWTTAVAIPTGFGLAFGGEFVIGAFIGTTPETAGAAGAGGVIAAEEAGLLEEALPEAETTVAETATAASQPYGGPQAALQLREQMRAMLRLARQIGDGRVAGQIASLLERMEMNMLRHYPGLF